MRLCFLSNPNSPHTRRWISWFANHGHQTCLIADTPEDTSFEAPWTGIETFNLPARFNAPVVKYLPWILWTRQIIRRWQPDILHAHRVTAGGWLGAFSGFHPFVVTAWGSDLYQYPYRSPLAAWLTRRVLKTADLVTADSEDLRQQALLFGAEPAQAHVVQFGVDLGLFHPGAPKNIRVEELRARLQIGSAPVVLSLRGIHPVYNQETFLSAIPLVREVLPNAIFILKDYNTDPAYKQKLEAQINDMGIAPSVRWLEKTEHWQQTVDYYRLAQVAVSIPVLDGTPVSVLEAMACGVPVVASDLPSLQEWICSGKNGWLTPTHDETALAKAIINLLQDPEQHARFRQHNLHLIQEKANHETEMRKMEHLYMQVLKQNTGKAG